MLGVYIHVPFCYRKCTYCNFLILPINKILEQKNILIENYITTLQKQIFESKNILKSWIKTIYFWGWTPSLLAFEDFEKIIDQLLEIDSQNLLELWIEINPDPFEKTYDLIEKICQKYKNLKKIRISIGIQSTDDEVLRATWRNYDYVWLEKYLEKILGGNFRHENGELKSPWLKKFYKNLFINLDFISFWTAQNLQNFEKIVLNSDSLSLYTLELFSWSAWHKDIQKRKKIKNIDEERIYYQFEKLKKIIEKNGFSRYEISNWEKNTYSIHNTIYWNMESYLWLGPWAHSYLSNDYESINNMKIWEFWTRFATSSNIKKYLDWVLEIDKNETFNLSEKDYLFEKFFLSLRTKNWVQLQDFEKILIPDYEVKIEDFESQKFLVLKDWILKLTDKWFRFYNSIITDLII